MINDDFFPTVSSQASEYDMVFVAWQTRPIKPNVYAEITPIKVMRMVDGITADGALPNTATPAAQRIQKKNKKRGHLEFLKAHIFHLERNVIAHLLGGSEQHRRQYS